MTAKTQVSLEDQMNRVYTSVENIENRILQENKFKLPDFAENHLRFAARSASVAPHINLGTFLRQVENFMLHLNRRISTEGLNLEETEFVLNGTLNICSPLIPNMPKVEMNNVPQTYSDWLEDIVGTMHQCAKNAGFFFYYLVVSVVVPEAFLKSPRIQIK